MAEDKPRKMPRFASLDELVDFFDTHDMGEYLDQMPEVHFEVDIKRHRFRIIVKPTLIGGSADAAQ